MNERLLYIICMDDQRGKAYIIKYTRKIITDRQNRERREEGKLKRMRRHKIGMGGVIRIVYQRYYVRLRLYTASYSKRLILYTVAISKL